MDVIATIDQGTQSTRVYIYDSDANPVASHHVEFTQHRAKAGYAPQLQNRAESAELLSLCWLPAAGLSMTLRKYGKEFRFVFSKL